MLCAILLVAMAAIAPRGGNLPADPARATPDGDSRPLVPSARRVCRRWRRRPRFPSPSDDVQADKLSLDDAIRIALANSEVIRVLGGSSGRTQYDPAIINTEIDQNRAAFDPTLEHRQPVLPHASRPGPFFDPDDPTTTS